jgi:hypothetical protein
LFTWSEHGDMGEPARTFPRIFPQRLQYAFAEVGQPVAEFRPSPLRVAVCIVGGVLLACAALTAGGFLLLHVDAGVFEVLTVVGVFGVVTAVGVWRVVGQRWLVCPGGLVRARGPQVECCPWEQVREIRETAGKSGLGEPTYTVCRKDAAEWAIDANAVGDLAGLAALLREGAERHAVAWRTVAAKTSTDE